MDMARSMMAEFKSSLNFWAEAISTACLYSNRLYLRKIINKTPYEILNGKKPNVGYFRVFGSKCFYQIKGLRLTKFQPKALEGIFVGYGEESHTYRIYDKASGIVVNSCSVIFEEIDSSQGGQVDVCADVEIPQDAVGRVSMKTLRPIEGHLAAEREGLCPIHIGSSSPQVHQSPIVETTNTPTEEQNANPPSSGQDQGQDQSRVDDGAAPSDVQDQVQNDEQPQDTEQA